MKCRIIISFLFSPSSSSSLRFATSSFSWPAREKNAHNLTDVGQVVVAWLPATVAMKKDGRKNAEIRYRSKTTKPAKMSPN